MNNKLISFRQTGQPALTKDADGTVTISIPIAIKRRSGRTIMRSPCGVTANPNRVDQDITPLQLALARGHRWLRMLEEGKVKSLREIAEKEKVDSSYVSRMVNLTLLAPDIVAAILDDQLPEGVSLFDLAVDVADLWETQRERIDGKGLLFTGSDHLLAELPCIPARRRG